MTTKTTFKEKFKMITGLNDEVVTQLLSYSHKSILVLNTLKANWQEVLDEIHKHATLIPLSDAKYCYSIESGKDSVTALPFFKDGNYYILNYSSLIPPLVLDAHASDDVLDMCAAPGGKTFMIARETDNQAQLYINEVDKRRFNNLNSLLTQLDVSVTQAFNTPAQGLMYVTPQKFTKILIDAPCSAEGLINLANTDSLKYWSQKKVKQLRNLQKKIVNCAYELLAEDGELVYSTCTYSPEENEEVIAYLLTKHKDLRVMAIDTKLIKENFIPALISWNNTLFTEDITKCIRILPTDLFEGFFVAKLKKLKH